MDNSKQGKNGSKNAPDNSAKTSVNAKASPINTKTPESISIDHPKQPISTTLPASQKPESKSTEQKVDKPTDVKTQDSKTPSSAVETQKDVKFKSTDIGVKTAVKQDPFAEQNKKAAEKKTKNNARRKKLIIAASIVGGVILLALIIWAIIMLINAKPQATTDEPKDWQPGTPVLPEDVVNVNQTVAALYQKNKDIASINQIFDEVTQSIENGNGVPDITEDGKVVQNRPVGSITEQTIIDRQLSEVYLAQMIFELNYGSIEGALQSGQKINPDLLNTKQQANYYNLMSLAYDAIGETEKAKEFDTLSNIKGVEAGGFGGSGE